MDQHSRRQILRLALAGTAGVLPPLCAGAAESPRPKEQPADVNATEDLMREHGVLRRILFVYEEGARRLDAGGAPADAMASAAQTVQRFVEGYHEKLEEQFVFPRMQRAGELIRLVQVLRAQHEAGRRVTAAILTRATPTGLATASGRQALAASLRSFIRMYGPHAAREDTDLFPAYHDQFTEKDFDALGDRFEEQEQKLLGSGGFGGAAKSVSDLEQALGIHDLAQFTPR